MGAACATASDGNTYFINMCQRGSQNITCFVDRQSTAPIVTYACQTVRSWAYSVDLGNTISFGPLENGAAEDGLTVNLYYGTPCSRIGKPRNTTILLLCDLEAGVGTCQR